MVFFKRLSRSRSNSQSYVDSYDSRHDSKTNSASYDDKYAVAPQVQTPTDIEHDQGVPIRSTSNAGPPQLGDPPAKDTTQSQDMYARRDRPTEVSSQDRYQYRDQSTGRQNMSNGYGGGLTGGYDSAPSKTNTAGAPDLLLQAFNQAIRPYSDKIENLEGEIADLKAYIDALERQRGEVHAWIDKRGLRPGKSSEFRRCPGEVILMCLQTYQPALRRSWTNPPTKPRRPTPPRRSTHSSIARLRL